MKRTPWAVRCNDGCNNGQLVFLTGAEYDEQMDAIDSNWKCPKCGADAYWDDDNYEEMMEDQDEFDDDPEYWGDGDEEENPSQEE